MKNLILSLLFLGVSFQVKSQTFDFDNLYLPKEDERIVYQKVIELPGLGKSEIFKRTNFWFIDTFKNPKDVINYNNPDEGIISGKGFLNLTWVNDKAVLVTPVTILLGFSLRIEVKDERVRYSIYELEMSDILFRNFRKVESEFVYEKMFSKKGKPIKVSWDWYYIYENSIISLENSIEKGVKKGNSEEW
jgi:hypothetical protein